MSLRVGADLICDKVTLLPQLFGQVLHQQKMYRVVVLSFLCFINILVLNANSLDPYQTPHSVASDQGLHCLPMLLLWHARHK